MKTQLSLWICILLSTFVVLQSVSAQRISPSKKWKLQSTKIQAHKLPKGLELKLICQPSPYFQPLVNHCQKPPACKVAYEIKHAWNDIAVDFHYEILTPFKDGRKIVWLTSTVKFKGYLKYDSKNCVFKGKVVNPTNGTAAFVHLSPNNNGKTTFQVGSDTIQFIHTDKGNHMTGVGKDTNNSNYKYRFKLTAEPNCSYVFGGKTYH